jgi:hypothetical protein
MSSYRREKLCWVSIKGVISLYYELSISSKKQAFRTGIQSVTSLWLSRICYGLFLNGKSFVRISITLPAMEPIYVRAEKNENYRNLSLFGDILS